MSDNKKEILGDNINPFGKLVEIIAYLRSEEGCAWDRKQTHKSLVPYLIEETYEVIEAIEKDDHPALKEELGDLMCQVIFHCQLASERKDFDIDDSLNCINDKLIKRHPHVFKDKKDLDPRQVKEQWEKIKVSSGEKKSVFSGIPKTMPALTKAFRVGEKAAGVGFDWNDAAQVMDKLDEEVEEVKKEVQSGNKEKVAEEIGDLLFAIASLARKMEINPELALGKALLKFQNRFALMEKDVSDAGNKLTDYSLDELEEIWQKIKK